MNSYQYVSNNSIRLTDPAGTNGVEDHINLSKNMPKFLERGKQEYNASKGRMNESTTGLEFYLEKVLPKYKNQIPEESELRNVNPHCPKCKASIKNLRLTYDLESRKVTGFLMPPGSGSYEYYYNLKGQLIGSKSKENPIQSVTPPWEYVIPLRATGKFVVKKTVGKGLICSGRKSAKGTRKGVEFENMLSSTVYKNNLNLNDMVNNFPVVDIATPTRLISVAKGSLKYLKGKFFNLFGFGLSDPHYNRMLKLLKGRIGEGSLSKERFIQQAALATEKKMITPLLKQILKDPQGEIIANERGVNFIKNMLIGL